MADQPLSLTWACFLRDHGTDLKVSKEARVLALALLTYGAGQRIFASMVTLSEVTGMKRDTVRKARRELQDKGLLEDITGDPAKQERTYRLTVPGYVVPERTTPKVVPERTTPGPLEHHPVALSGTTPGPREDHNIKPLDLDLDQALTSSLDDGAPENQTQPQSQNPDPDRGEDEYPADGGAVRILDWDDPDDGEAVAESLGVPLSSIGQPFRDWFTDLTRSGEMDPCGADYLAVHYAVKDSSLARRCPFTGVPRADLADCGEWR